MEDLTTIIGPLLWWQSTGFCKLGDRGPGLVFHPECPVLSFQGLFVSVDGDLGRSRKVFVVQGRNDAARATMFAFLRAIGLDPIEWSVAVQMTGEGSPYIGQVLDVAFDAAQAIVVLLTPDDIAYLRTEYANGEDDPETQALAQARPNVLFEAGMAMGRDGDGPGSEAHRPGGTREVAAVQRCRG